MRLRQAVLAASSLEPTRTQLFELLGIEADFADPGVAEFGLANSVMSIGDSFLEIVSPIQPGTAAGRLLERREQTCGYMLLFQVDDYAATAERLRGLEMRTVWSVELEAASACHVHPKDIGGAIVSFDQMRPPDEWIWGGPSWRSQRATRATRVLGCTLQSPDGERLAARWSAALDRPAEDTADGVRIPLDDGSFVDFVHGSDFEGIRGFTFATADPEASYARAREQGLGDERPALGDLELAFVRGGDEA